MFLAHQRKTTNFEPKITRQRTSNAFNRIFIADNWGKSVFGLKKRVHPIKWVLLFRVSIYFDYSLGARAKFGTWIPIPFIEWGVPCWHASYFLLKIVFFLISFGRVFCAFNFQVFWLILFSVHEIFVSGSKYFRYPNSINWFLFISFYDPSHEALQFTAAIVMFTITRILCLRRMRFGLEQIQFRPSIKIAKLFTIAFALYVLVCFFLSSSMKQIDFQLVYF